MKKSKLTMFTLANVALLTLTACAGQGEQRNAPLPQGESAENENAEPTPSKPADNIFDAFEDSRPDYGDMFDFVPDYVKPEPPKPYEKVMVTIDGSSGVKFKDGTTSKEILGGTYLTNDLFDVSAVKDNREIAGFVVDSEGINPNDVIPSDSLVIGRNPMTITPIFGPKPGFVSCGFQKFNPSSCHGSMVSNGTISYLSTAPIKGGEGEPILLGHKIQETSFVTEGSIIRMDLPCASLKDKEGVFEFYYHFENFGEDEIHFNLYQVNGWKDHDDDTYKSKHFRMDVDLLPGQSMNIVSQNILDKNDNKLLLIEADRKMPNGFTFGFSIETKLTELEVPETVSKPEPPIAVKVNLDLPEGMTVSEDYNGNAKSGDAITYPTAEQITDTKNRKIKGWFMVINGQKLS